jgi:imidazolonepropionase-like amidohydrolase
MRNLIKFTLVLLSGISSLVSAQSSVQAGTIEDTSPDKAVLITGAKIHTMGSLGILENSDILITDGVIKEVGTGLVAPEGAKVIDAQGKEITPGLINVVTSLGLVEVDAIKSTVDSSNTEKEYSASFSIADVINPNSSLWSHNRNNGLTHAIIVPSNSKAIIQGQASLIQLSDDLEYLVARDNAVFMTYGDAAAERAGGSRALALQMIRAIFADLRAMTEADDMDKFKPESDLKLRELKALLPVLTDSKPLVVTAHRANDILQMLKLANDYALTMIIRGAEEAWQVRDQVAAAKVALIVNPYNNLPNRFETIGNRIDQMTLLHEAGIPLMISNSDSHNAYVVRQIAGNAAAYGLPSEVALASMTRTPAEWFGINDRYGTLESGMQADLVIWDGDPLEVTTSAEQVFIKGEAMPMTSRQTMLRDRYLNKDNRRAGYRH